MASSAPRRSGSRRVSASALEQFDAAATLDAPGTPQLRDAPGTPTSPRVTFREDAMFVQSVDAHPQHVSHALRGRAEGLRIQAELLEREAAHHETRHKVQQGESCGAGAGNDIQQAWDKSVKALEQVRGLELGLAPPCASTGRPRRRVRRATAVGRPVAAVPRSAVDMKPRSRHAPPQLCGAAVALCISAGSCGGAAQAPRPTRSSTARLSALKPGCVCCRACCVPVPPFAPPAPDAATRPRPPPGLAPVRSYERPLPLADPGVAPPPPLAQEASQRGAPGVPPQRMPSALRRSSSGILLPPAEPQSRPVRELTRSGSAPLERRSRSVPAAPEAPSMWRRALRNLSNARKPAAAPAEKGEFATGSGSPRSQTRFNFGS